jgi:chaperonin GroES
MAKSIRPLNDRILVQRIEAEQKTAGGILIPDNAKEKPAEGRVLAVGNGKILEDGSRRALEVKVGDRILFGKWSGTEVKLDGVEQLLLKEEEVLAIMEN